MSDIEQNKSHKDDQSLAIKEFIGPQADYYKTQFENQLLSKFCCAMHGLT